MQLTWDKIKKAIQWFGKKVYWLLQGRAMLKAPINFFSAENVRIPLLKGKVEKEES